VRAGTVHPGWRHDRRNLPAEATAHATANPRALSQHALRAPLGGYRLLEWKLPDYIVPDLKNFEARSEKPRSSTAHSHHSHPSQLKPYVSYLTKAPPKTTA